MPSLQKPVGVAWISADALAVIVQEFRQSRPRETGGVLIGYEVTKDKDIVITQAVGPGPRATHNETSFTPDWLYHESEIARRYEKSGRMHTYLGDWHSHPDAATQLSLTDRHTLSKIAKHTDARIRTPLMVIIAECDPLKIQVWRYLPAQMFGMRRPKIVALRIQHFA